MAKLLTRIRRPELQSFHVAVPHWQVTAAFRPIGCPDSLAIAVASGRADNC